ncbi:MAG: nuclear transport factor 2 family protein [Halomonas sp.]|nr:nuclear transport factor 2 family protein [Halomonas sp.]
MNKAELNAEAVRRGYQAFNEDDLATLADIFDREVTWHTPGQSPYAGTHRGMEAVFMLFGHYKGETGGTFKVTLKRVFTNEEGHVVSSHHASAKREDKSLEVDGCIAFEFRDGRIVSGKEYIFDLYALDAFWQ